MTGSSMVSSLLKDHCSHPYKSCGGTPQNPNPDGASKHPYNSFSINWGIGHLAVMILFLLTEALSTEL
jgi:hypothetical protein